MIFSLRSFVLGQDVATDRGITKKRIHQYNRKCKFSIRILTKFKQFCPILKTIYQTLPVLAAFIQSPNITGGGRKIDILRIRAIFNSQKEKPSSTRKVPGWNRAKISPNG